MSLEKSQQSMVIDWFNHTYRTKGERYLRPAKAYYVYMELLRAQANEHLLDVACGLGRLLEVGREYQCKLYGIDISPVAIETAAQKIPSAELQVGNAELLPFASEQFDMVTCLGSLERFLDKEAALKELYRVGTERARYCFLVRNANTFTWRYLKQGLKLINKQGHQGAKTLDQWTKLFEKNGFRILKVLPDQYPLHRRAKWLSLGIKQVDYRAIVDTTQPLESANEFIFMLGKQGLST